MKISIWKQFSSNHSGGFDVVGVFNDANSAQKASDEFQKIIQAIHDWHQNNPQKADALYKEWADGEQRISEIEEILAKQYNLRWHSGIEWFDDAQVEIIQNHIVHLTTKFQISDGPQPFVQLIEHFGGYGLISGSANGNEPFGDIWVQLWCIAPDENTAIKIEQSKPPFTDYDKVLSTVRRNGTSIYLGWEWREGGWSLVELINELQELGCTDLTYHFTGKVYSETPKYRIQSKDSDDNL